MFRKRPDRPRAAAVNGNAAPIAEIVLACKALHAEGQSDLVLGHVSLRAPGGDTFWMKGAGLAFEEVTAADVLLLGLDGAVLEGTRPRHQEWPIHAGILRARPDVNCVVHTHALHAIAFDATGVPLRPISHDGARFVPPDVPRFAATSDLIVTPELGAAVADTLGSRNALFLRNHGIVTAASEVSVACLLAIYLDRACKVQLLAMSSGAPYAWTPDAEAETKRSRFGGIQSDHGPWEYYRRRFAAT